LDPLDLPWFDAERAVLIAVNQNPGNDVAIALDYRTDVTDPKVGCVKAGWPRDDGRNWPHPGGCG
jgi:hypothetical protein